MTAHQIEREDDEAMNGAFSYDADTLKVGIDSSDRHPPFLGTGNIDENSDEDGPITSDGGCGGYVCPQCQKRFQKKANLTRHLKVHADPVFACSQCDKKFRKKWNLTKHEKLHTGEKPYACSECGKKFADSSNLYKHLRTHTGEKPFACPTCEKRFAQPGDLRRHEKGHSRYGAGTSTGLSIPFGPNSFQMFKNDLIDTDGTEESKNESNVLMLLCAVEPIVSTQDTPVRLVDIQNSENGPEGSAEMPEGPVNPLLTATNSGTAISGSVSVEVTDGSEQQTEQVTSEHFIQETGSVNSDVQRSRTEKRPGEVIHFSAKATSQNISKIGVLYPDTRASRSESSSAEVTSPSVQDQQVNTKNDIPSSRSKSSSGEAASSSDQDKEAIRVSCASKETRGSGLSSHKSDQRLLCSNDQDIASSSDEEESAAANAECESDYPIFVCPECSKRFLKKSYLKKHLVVHGLDKLVTCSDCDERFKLKSNLLYHLFTAHGKGKPFLCEVCKAGFPKRFNFVRHIRMHVEKKSLSCSGYKTEFAVTGIHTSMGDNPSWDGMRFSEQQPDPNTPECHDLHSHGADNDMPIHRSEKTPCCREHETINSSSDEEIIAGDSKQDSDPVFVCSECSKQFQKESSLKRHLAEHGIEKPFTCSECDERFKKQSNLIFHLFESHSRGNPFVCVDCKAAFPKRFNFERHLRIHKGKKSFAGTSYNRAAQSSRSDNSSKVADIKKQHDVNATSGHNADSSVIQGSGARTQGNDTEIRSGEQLTVESPPDEPDSVMRLGSGSKDAVFICPECNKGFKKKKYLNMHRAVHTGKRYITCPECVARFTKKSNLVYHLFKSHGRGEPRICVECKAGFLKRFNYERHVRLHSKGKLPESADYTTKTDRKQRVQADSDTRDSDTRMPRSEDPSEVPNITEEQEDEVGSEPGSLDNVTSEKAEKQEECAENENADFSPDEGSSTADPGDPNKPAFVCPECNKRFKKKRYLKGHIHGVHGGEKHIICSECDARFRKKSNLIYHLFKAHNKGRPLVCDECEAGFPKRFNFERHLRMHTGEKPFGCTICDKRFSDNKYLVKHLAEHNAQEQFVFIDCT